jgi:translation elongation factor P/translation initiation factor 5A
MESFNIRPIEFASIKKDFFIMIKSRPCKISNISHAKTGKHGSTKVAMTGYDVLTNKKYECMGAGHMQTKQFDCIRNIFQLVSLEDDTITCLNEACEQVSYFLSENDPMYKEVQKFSAHVDENDVYVSILFAPVETSSDEYVVEHIIENCKFA